MCKGSEVILGDSSHMYLFEQSNIAQIAGVSPRVIANKPDGTLDLNSIEVNLYVHCHLIVIFILINSSCCNTVILVCNQS